MNTQLNELEQKLEQLSESTAPDKIRAIFDIGVEFGALLQNQNIQNYKYEFWSKLDVADIKRREILNIEKSIEKILLTLVRKSIEEYIKKNYSWSISKGNWTSTFDEFQKNTVKKYCVQITRVNMTTYGGDFECNFQVVGKLADLFKLNNISIGFDMNIFNDNGDESLSISDVGVVGRHLSCLNCHVENGNNWELEQYTEFLNEIKECFLTDLLIEA